MTPTPIMFQEEMVSISIRPLLVPGVALATAGVMAMGPTMVAPPAVTLAQPAVSLPTVHIEDVQLASFGLDLYTALNGWAAFGVQVLQDIFSFSPAIAAGIGNAYTLLEPIITAVATFIDTIAQGPSNIISAITALVSSVFGIGLPSLSAAAKSSAPRAAASRTRVGNRAAAVAEAELPAEVAAAVTAPTRALRGAAHRAAEPAVAGARRAARAAAAEVPAVAQEAVASTAGEARSNVRAGRGAVAKAARAARTAAESVANTAG